MKILEIFDFKNNKIGVKDIIFVIILLLICFTQFKIIRLLNKNYYINLSDKNANLEDNFIKNYNNFIKELYDTRLFLDEIINTNKNFIFNNKKNNLVLNDNVFIPNNKTTKRQFVFYPKTELNEKEFIFTLKLPRDFDENKLNVSFKDKILNISFEELKENSNGSYYSSFTKSFSVDTNINETDIIKTIEDNTLKIVLPIKK